METTVTLNKSVELGLNNPLSEFVNFMGKKVNQFGENFGVLCQKTAIADEIGKDVRTVTRYLSELKEMDIIDTAAKRGRNGGTVIMFNKDMLDFEPQENPYTSETKTAQEVRNKFMPNKPKKEPKRRYRSKTEIAEERILVGKRRSEEQRLNNILAQSEFPTKEFFNETASPVLYLNAYLISRMYNAYTVIFPEIRMNQAEAERDIDSFENAQSYKELYKDYDCLKKEFIGTPTFNHFLKFAEYAYNNNIDPLAYLTVQFNYMDFLIRNNSNNVHLPFINALLSEVSLARYHREENYRTKFKKDHPYYVLSPQALKVVGMKYPIIELLNTAYENPMGYKTPFEDILKTTNDYLFTNNKSRVLVNYLDTIKEEVNNADLTEDKKAVILKFVKQQVATHMGKQALVPQQYLTAFHMQIGLMHEDYKEKNARQYYATLGDFNKSGFVSDAIERASLVKRGYLLDFSLHGSTQFYNTIRTIADIRELSINPDDLGEAIKEFGERKIPIDKYGFLDVHSIFSKVLTDENLDQDRENTEVIALNDKKELDLSGYMWYDVLEDSIGMSIRDGKAVHV